MSAPWWITLLLGVLRILLPALMAEREPVREAATQPDVKRRLRERVRATWGAGAAGLMVAVLVLPGCAQVVYVPPGEPVRLRETVPEAKVWIMGPDGEPIAGTMDLPAGWYCLPLEPEG